MEGFGEEEAKALRSPVIIISILSFCITWDAFDVDTESFLRDFQKYGSLHVRVHLTGVRLSD